MIRMGLVPAVLAVSLCIGTACTKAPAKTTDTKASGKTAKAGKTKPTVAPQASRLIDVAFDVPGSTPRPLKESTVLIYQPTEKLMMRITGISYRGIVCGFSLRGVRPASPVAIRLSGVKAAGTKFDSGPVAVTWSDDGVVEAGAAENGSWSFSAEAHANRNGSGWVISIGGVTAAAKDAVPKSAQCELTAPTRAFLPGVGPIGYWAGYATV